MSDGSRTAAAPVAAPRGAPAGAVDVARGRPPDPAVLLDRVSVRFRVPRRPIRTFKEYAIRRLQRRVETADFWALSDVSLSVAGGETLGLIGANGAGKSTLLKVVAQVLLPTHGRVRVRGRVAPLLECGAGFHPELTGRENVFLNGTLLGASRRAMSAALDRIVEFAGVADFIDAPVRTYSSGMLARLGFAIATDVRPEVLILDEVLAVGDDEFRDRSAARIQAFRDQGTAILLASHSLDAVRTSCARTAWVDRGTLVAIGPSDEVVAAYSSRPRA
jgi:ABC-type polysaccharide/polyol phosphate transport system ATPase subunit